jgi:predicted DNA-binding protein (UPF0251 family)
VATLEDVAAADPKPMGQPEQALEMQEVYATIAGLPEDFRLVLVAVDVLGLSYREAARALHVREATITTRLFRARKQVSERLLPPEHPATAGSTGHTQAPPGPASDGSVRGSPQRASEAQPAEREENKAGGVLQGRGTP